MSDDFLFLYEKPFTVKNTQKNRYEYLSETLSMNQYERSDILEMNAGVIKFLIENEICRLIDDKLYSGNKDNIGSWSYVMNWTNPRALNDKDKLATFIESFTTNEQDPINRVLNFHSILGARYDHRLLNTLANRTMSSVALVGVPNKNPSNIETWDNIHRTYPWLWLVIYIQNILKFESTERV